MHKLFRLLMLLAFLSVAAVGCNQGPQSATEEEALQGMDDMSAFEDAAAIEGEQPAPPADAGGDAAEGDAPADESATPE